MEGEIPEWKIRRYVYIYIPGSSRYVKFLPFGRFLGEFRHKFYTLGRCRYIYIYDMYVCGGFP